MVIICLLVVLFTSTVIARAVIQVITKRLLNGPASLVQKAGMLEALTSGKSNSRAFFKYRRFLETINIIKSIDIVALLGCCLLITVVTNKMLLYKFIQVI